jgi:hypothetical protein
MINRLLRAALFTCFSKWQRHRALMIEQKLRRKQLRQLLHNLDAQAEGEVQEEENQGGRWQKLMQEKMAEVENDFFDREVVRTQKILKDFQADEYSKPVPPMC